MSEPAAGDATRQRDRAPFVLRILGGCLVVAIIVGVGLAAERFISDDDLELPDEVGGLAVDDSDRGARPLRLQRRARSPRRYDGADAVTALYGRETDRRWS